MFSAGGEEDEEQGDEREKRARGDERERNEGKATEKKRNGHIAHTNSLASALHIAAQEKTHSSQRNCTPTLISPKAPSPKNPSAHTAARMDEKNTKHEYVEVFHILRRSKRTHPTHPKSNAPPSPISVHTQSAVVGGFTPGGSCAEMDVAES